MKKRYALRMMSRAWDRAYGPRLLICGGLLFLVFAYSLFQNWRCTQWPTAIGKVEWSKVESRYGSNGRYKSNVICIAYRFQVDGETYLGRRVGSADIGSEFYVRSLVNRYPAGKTVTVYYNPNYPQRAVLEPGLALASGENVVFGILGLVCLIAGGILTWTNHSKGSVERFQDFQKRWRERRIARRLARANPIA